MKRKLYLPETYPVLVGKGRGIGLCTAWADPRLFLNSFSGVQEKVALIGTLYSLEGINIILRNLLLNPDVRTLILWAHTPLSRTSFGKQGWQALKTLWERGLREACNLGFAPHPQLTPELIELLREEVRFLDFSELEFPKLCEKLEKVRVLAPQRKPIELEPFSPALPETFPSEEIGFIARAQDVVEAWLEALFLVLRFGKEKVSEDGQKTKEIVGLNTVLQKPSGTIDLEKIPSALYSKLGLSEEALREYQRIFLEKEKSEKTAYTYGKRLRAWQGLDQVDMVVEKLKKNPETRRAVLLTWDPAKDLQNTLPPCAVLFQFLVQEGKLFTLAIWRSQDIFKAYLPNLQGVLALREYVAQKTGLEKGGVKVVSFSAHIYQEDIEDIKRLLACQRRKRVFDPELDLDARGSFVIRLDRKKKEIILEWQAGGKILKTFIFNPKERRLSDFLRELYFEGAISRVDHALDIGEQLGKAEMALKYDLPFEQDKT